jgi:hypothetical protein
MERLDYVILLPSVDICVSAGGDAPEVADVWGYGAS